MNEVNGAFTAVARSLVTSVGKRESGINVRNQLNVSGREGVVNEQGRLFPPRGY